MKQKTPFKNTPKIQARKVSQAQAHKETATEKRSDQERQVKEP